MKNFKNILRLILNIVVLIIGIIFFISILTYHSDKRYILSPHLFQKENAFPLSQELLLYDSLRNSLTTTQIDKLIQSLGYANISFNVPQELFLDEEEPLALVASNGLTRKILENRLDSILGKRNIDKIESHEIKASALIEAQLTGESFSVTSGSPVRQPLSGFNITKWEWIVEPKEKGDKFLTLTVNAILNHNGKEIPYTIETFNKKIKVKVKNRFWYWIKTNETLILGVASLIVTLLAAYLGYYLGKKSSNKEKEISENNLLNKKTISNV